MKKRFQKREEKTMTTNETAEAKSEAKKETAPRDIAEFKGVDRIKSLEDYSGIENTKIRDPHPGLVYRGVRPGKVAYCKERGYLTHPPNARGKLAEFSGPVSDLVPMAIDRDLYNERQAKKAEMRARTREALKPRKDGDQFAGGEEIGTGATMRKEATVERQIHKEHPTE